MVLARPTWKTIDPALLVQRRWGDDHVIYNCISGDTHLLNSAASEALRLLAEAPSSAGILACRLADSLVIPADPNFEAEIAHLLARLDELGLIEPVQS